MLKIALISALKNKEDAAHQQLGAPAEMRAKLNGLFNGAMVRPYHVFVFRSQWDL